MYVSVSVRTFLLQVPENSTLSGIRIVGSGPRGVRGESGFLGQGRLRVLRGCHSGPGFTPSLKSVSSATTPFSGWLTSRGCKMAATPSTYILVGI